MPRLRYPLLLVLVLCARPSVAHEVRPGYLQLTQTALDTFELLFKVPAMGDRRLGLHPKLPDHCEPVAPPVAYNVGGAYTERAVLRCRTDLTGETITIEGLSSTLTDVLVRFERLDGTVQVARVTPAAPSFVVEASPTAVEVAATYLTIGVEHIVFGIEKAQQQLG